MSTIEEIERGLKGRKLVIRSEYFNITGDLNAAALLTQICYRLATRDSEKSRGVVELRGEHFIALPRKHWSTICFLSPYQVDMGLKRLARLQLIDAPELRQRRGVNMLHITVNTAQLCAMLDGQQSVPKD